MSDYFECETPDGSNSSVQAVPLELEVVRVHDDSGAFQEIRLVVSEQTSNGVFATITETWPFDSKKDLLKYFPTFESILEEVKKCDAWVPVQRTYMYYFCSVKGSSGVYEMPEHTPSIEAGTNSMFDEIFPSKKVAEEKQPSKKRKLKR